MKYIFDFDDVLFNTTKRSKEYLYPLMENLGILHKDIEIYYKKKRKENFSLIDFLDHFHLEPKLYQQIMQDSIKFANLELIEIVKKLGKENCSMVTYGDKVFQLDKIKSIGIEDLFAEIIVATEDDKKEFIEKICLKFKHEKVLFIDDKQEYFDRLDLKKCPNLKTILFDEQGLEKLKLEIKG